MKFALEIIIICYHDSSLKQSSIDSGILPYSKTFMPCAGMRNTAGIHS